MSSKSLLWFGSLALLGSAQAVACSSPFHSCRDTRTCPAGGASGMAGSTAAAGKGGAKAGASQGGNAGLDDTQGGEAGTAGEPEDLGDTGTGGIAGEEGVGAELEIEQPSLATGKTYVPFTAKISAHGANHYSWTLTSGALPVGLTLQGAHSATVTVGGTPSEAGQFPIGLSVTDGSTTKAVDVTLTVTHSALFLSDRNQAGVNELFLSDIGAASATAPVRLNASLPAGGNVSSYAWSPDGRKVLYLATQSSGGPAELWVASLASPGAAQRVSAQGLSIAQAIWLGAGNIAAYSTSVGNTYLTDLSAATPGPSTLAVSGYGDAAVLRASPNGTSLGVRVVNETIHANEISYVTWSSNGPTVVSLQKVQGDGPYFGYGGKYALITSGPSASLLDLSLPVPTENHISSGNGVKIAWRPNAEAFFMVVGGGQTYSFSRADFTAAGMTTTILATANNCSGVVPVSWAPDGTNGFYGCAAEVRGISNLSTAVAGADFSLLPSGFLAEGFTDTQSVGWSPDSKWIALRADRDTDAQYDLQLMRWSAPGALYKPHANSIAQGVAIYAFAPNSHSIAFVGAISPEATPGLYLTQLPSSGAPALASQVSSQTSTVQTDINWLPGSRVLTYRAIVGGTAQLFAVPVAADGTAGSPVSISGVSGGAVTSYQLAPIH